MIASFACPRADRRLKSWLAAHGAVARRVDLGEKTFTTPKGEVRTIRRSKEVHDLADGRTVEVIVTPYCAAYGETRFAYDVVVAA